MKSTIISNLALAPEYENQTLKLIEKSFHYSPDNSFKVDFYPLMNKSNYENCFILIENNKVKAHIGALPLQLEINESLHPVIFYGGICVDENSQGRGFFRELYNFVNDQFPNAALHLLWSDKVDLYEKFGFYPAITQYQYTQTPNANNSYKEKKLKDLSEDEYIQIKSLYNSSGEHRIHRDDLHWENLKQILSTKLFIKKENDVVTNYFFMNKGEDLTGVIHEYGKISAQDISEVIQYGTLWSSQLFENYEPDTLFGSLVKIGNTHEFTEFVSRYTNDFFKVEKVDSSLVHFQFAKNSISMGHEEFLQGLLGPNTFEELTHLSPIFISGLDSV